MRDEEPFGQGWSRITKEFYVLGALHEDADYILLRNNLRGFIYLVIFF